MKTENRTEMPNLKPQTETDLCPRCEKPKPTLCFCSEIEAIANTRPVLILQHPQEPDKLLGTARLANLNLKNSALLVGLSWPNLAKAIERAEFAAGDEVSRDVADWAVLYLGSQPEDKTAAPLRAFAKYKNEISVDTDGEMKALGSMVKGVIVIDGTWSQAKAIWWRNAWLSKLKRLALNPSARSLYGDLRKEPRRECLSTIESIAETLEVLGEPAENSAALRATFSRLIEKYKASGLRATKGENKSGGGGKRRGRPSVAGGKPDWRRKKRR